MMSISKRAVAACMALGLAVSAGCGQGGGGSSKEAAADGGAQSNGSGFDINVPKGGSESVNGLGFAMDSAVNGITEGGCVVVPAEQPDWNTEEYSDVDEQPFRSAAVSPLSTFAADVDTASYSNIRRMVLGEGRTEVPSGAVRIEEMLNYFRYESYAMPGENEPFGVTAEFGDCPWNSEARLLRIGLRTQGIDFSESKPSNLVFLLDTSGSMEEDLQLVKYAFGMLLENLGEKDRVSIVTYAGGDTVVLDGARGDEKARISNAINSLEASGGTNGSAGIETAYKIAEENFIKGGFNRVVLATDGDLNIGQTSESELSNLVKEKKQSGVFLSVLGFGYGNVSDTRLETLADDGNGTYAYIDSRTEAKRVMASEIGGTLVTVAKDVKLQAEFNPAYVKGYRLVGYDNRVMAAEDFNDDTKDGGEIGAGHEVTVLYEVIPVGSGFEIPEVETKYGSTGSGVENGEWLNLKVRYKEPEKDESNLLEYPVKYVEVSKDNEDDFQFAAMVAEFGMILKDSQHKGSSSCEGVLETLRGMKFTDELRREFVDIVSAVSSGK